MTDRKRNSSDSETAQLLEPSSLSTVQQPQNDPLKQKMLLISFVLMVFIGLGNKVFGKLETIPMYNYPYFTSQWTTFIYIPLSFAYIIPMILWGKSITWEQRNIPWYKFAVMGALDGISSIMQVFAINYIPNGGLIILLMQSAIPISMIISKFLLKTKYALQHYIGAVIVAIGLIVVLVPALFKQGNDEDQSTAILFVWCMVLVLSCIPMTLSSVYKEKALGETEIDVVYMNGWVAIYQFMIGLLLAIPSAYASNITIGDLPENVWNGFRCYIGINSITTGDHIDDCSPNGPLFVNVYLLFNVLYNILIILILKHGSSNLLWLAMTIMVPLGNITFALPFVPNNQPMSVYDILGLITIMVGLIIFRFFDKVRVFISSLISSKRRIRLAENDDDDLTVQRT